MPSEAAITPTFGIIQYLPNALTCSRIFAIPIILALALEPASTFHLAASLTFALASITDWLDGLAARLLNSVSGLGRILDPIADKMLVAATLIILATSPDQPRLLTFLAMIIILREIAVTGLREYLAQENVVIHSTYLAKSKTALQMIAITALFIDDKTARSFHLHCFHFHTIGMLSLGLATIAGIVSAFGYAQTALHHSSLTVRRPN